MLTTSSASPKPKEHNVIGAHSLSEAGVHYSARTTNTIPIQHLHVLSLIQFTSRPSLNVPSITPPLLRIALMAQERQEQRYEPPLSQRLASSITIGVVGFLCRSFLYGLSRTETHGLEQFLKLLDGRKDDKVRERGLITVSNHLSVYVHHSIIVTGGGETC